MTDKINVRVYGILIKDMKILALYEEYAGEQLLKLPGGGLEPGEGVSDCLKREFDEELNLKIIAYRHFYTQDDFVASRFRENEQILTVYYLVTVEQYSDMMIMDPCIEKAEWLPLDLEENPFQLPVDHRVYNQLKDLYINGKLKDII